MKRQKALELLKKYLDGKATFEEKALIEKWYSLEENAENIKDGLDLVNVKESLYQRIVAELDKEKLNEKAIVVPMYKKFFFRVAATIIILLSAGVFFLYNKKQQSEVAQTETANPLKNDVAPGGDKAVLTLADGSQIILDNAKNGNLANQGDIKVIKLDGQLAYNGSNQSTEVLYNTISTPKGGQYQLVLADGSKVWLNAASSLRFPASFIGKERKVELTGEGYFEVAKDADMPFKVVMNNGMEVEVLGTHFNVMGYDDEGMVKTTLVEGKVKVIKGSNHIMLLPNQQGSLLRENDNLKIDWNADVNKAISWKNGLFDFDNDAITDIMRQLARWYDVEIQYSGNIVAQFYTGSIRRQVNISQVLFMLEQAGGVQFKIEGKKIIVKTK
ncbi:MAG: FecR family protein [Chitinophagaceae bacterium]|nr:FecR family protein [Chitinophagaceae bacterium]